MEIIFLIAILIMSVVIHEVAHGYVALMQGDPTAKYQGRLTLNPIVHLDMVGSVLLPGLLLLTSSPFLIGWAKPVPYNPYNFRDQRWGELWVAIAGPVTNISIAIVFGLFLRFTLPLDTLSPAVVQISVMIVLINIVLALFNMIPVPPLDGSKVLFAFLPARYYGIRRFMEQYSFILIIAVIFILFSTNILGYAIFTVFGMLVGDPQILFQTLNALF